MAEDKSLFTAKQMLIIYGKTLLSEMAAICSETDSVSKISIEDIEALENELLYKITLLRQTVTIHNNIK